MNEFFEQPWYATKNVCQEARREIPKRPLLMFPYAGLLLGVGVTETIIEAGRVVDSGARKIIEHFAENKK